MKKGIITVVFFIIAIVLFGMLSFVGSGITELGAAIDGFFSDSAGSSGEDSTVDEIDYCGDTAYTNLSDGSYGHVRRTVSGEDRVYFYTVTSFEGQGGWSIYYSGADNRNVGLYDFTYCDNGYCDNDPSSTFKSGFEDYDTACNGTTHTGNSVDYFCRVFLFIGYTTDIESTEEIEAYLKSNSIGSSLSSENICDPTEPEGPSAGDDTQTEVPSTEEPVSTEATTNNNYWVVDPPEEGPSAG